MAITKKQLESITKAVGGYLSKRPGGNAVLAAKGLVQMKRESNKTNRQLAAILGVDASVICKLTSILRLPERAIEFVESGILTPTSAYELSKTDDMKLIEEVLEAIKEKRVTRDDIVQLIKAKRNSRHVTSKRFKVDKGVTITVTAGWPISREAAIRIINNFSKGVGSREK